jgi:hypothetical protein
MMLEDGDYLAVVDHIAALVRFHTFLDRFKESQLFGEVSAQSLLNYPGAILVDSGGNAVDLPANIFWHAG